MFTGKTFDEISEVDIHQLVADKIPEGRLVDYKSELPGGSDGQRKEYAADVTSFANAAGGYIIYGVVEQKDASGKNTGVPSSAEGLLGINADEAILRLESMARANVDPPIPGLRIKAIQGLPKGPLLLVYIPKSWAGPHMVAVGQDSRFHTRGSAGKQSLTASEIRSAFLLSEELPARIRRFRDERLGRVVADETPVPLSRDGKLVLHLVPFSSLGVEARTDLNAWSKASGLQPMSVGGGWNDRFNFDGFVAFSGPRSGAQRSYLQVLRNGAIEAVMSLRDRNPDGNVYINPWWIEEELVSGIRRYLGSMRTHGADAPVSVLVTLLGVKGSVLPPSERRWSRDEQEPIGQDVLVLPDVLARSFEEDIPQLLRPAFDALWQAAGQPRSLCYDEQGTWNPTSFRW